MIIQRVTTITITYVLWITFAICESQFNHPPPFWQKAKVARWLVHENIWGTLSTTSVHLHGQAWGQAKSFADGSSNNSTGNLYFYDSSLDTSLQDIAKNPEVSFSLSMAQQNLCPVRIRDPEDPTCARLTISGIFSSIYNEEEKTAAKDFLFDRHPTMQYWPIDHQFDVYRIDIQEIWLIDIYGGAAIVDVNEYYAVQLDE